MSSLTPPKWLAAQDTPESVITVAIHHAVKMQPTDADVDQVINDTVAALWPPEPQ